MRPSPTFEQALWTASNVIFGDEWNRVWLLVACLVLPSWIAEWVL
jgi:hypothetical protein